MRADRNTMLRFSRSGRWWVLFLSWTTLAVVWATQLLVYDKDPPLKGYTPAGMFFGIVGTLLILLVFLYSWRRSRLGFGMGSLRWWIESHIYFGTLAVVFILAHSGYRFHASVPNLAFLFLILVVLSGIVGWAVLIYLPGLNQSIGEWPIEVSEICKRLGEIHDKIAELCSDNPGPFLDVYNEVVIPLYRPTRKKPAAVDLSKFASNLPEEKKKDFQRLVSLVEEARLRFVQLDLNQRFRLWLKSWLMVHLPLSSGLVIFSLAHIVSVIWY